MSVQLMGEMGKDFCPSVLQSFLTGTRQSGRYVVAPSMGNKEGNKGHTILRVRHTEILFPTEKNHTTGLMVDALKAPIWVKSPSVAERLPIS